MSRVRISLSMDIPEEATREDCLAYVVEAVMSWKGQCRPPGAYGDDDPGNPMFGLDGRSVRASYVTTHKNQRRIVRCSAED